LNGSQTQIINGITVNIQVSSKIFLNTTLPTALAGSLTWNLNYLLNGQVAGFCRYRESFKGKLHNPPPPVPYTPADPTIINDLRNGIKNALTDDKFNTVEGVTKSGDGGGVRG
jgi:hypothetical protein